jgi:hypothetical protein
MGLVYVVNRRSPVDDRVNLARGIVIRVNGTTPYNIFHARSEHPSLFVTRCDGSVAVGSLLDRVEPAHGPPEVRANEMPSSTQSPSCSPSPPLRHAIVSAHGLFCPT